MDAVAALRALLDALAPPAAGPVAAPARSPELERFAAKVADAAHTVTDEDIRDLVRAGYDDDAIFEHTLRAAAAAARLRLERGLGALRGAPP